MAAKKNNVQAMYRIPRIDPARQAAAANGNGQPSNGAEQLTQFANQSIVNGKHPVTVLQEVCLKRKWKQPVYTIVNEEGPAHKKHFVMKCTLNQVDYVPSFSSPNKVGGLVDEAFVATSGYLKLLLMNVFRCGSLLISFSLSSNLHPPLQKLAKAIAAIVCLQAFGLIDSNAPNGPG